MRGKCFFSSSSTTQTRPAVLTAHLPPEPLLPLSELRAEPGNPCPTPGTLLSPGSGRNAPGKGNYFPLARCRMMHHFLRAAPQARPRPGQQQRRSRPSFPALIPGHSRLPPARGGAGGPGQARPVSAALLHPHPSAAPRACSPLWCSLKAPGTPQPLCPSPGMLSPCFPPTFPRCPPPLPPRPSGPALTAPPHHQLLPLRSHLAARGAAPPAVRRCWEAGGRRGALPGQVRCVGTAPGPRSPLRRPPAATDHYLAACPPGPVSAERDPGITIAQVPAAAQRACAQGRAGGGGREMALPSAPLAAAHAHCGADAAGHAHRPL